MKEPRTMKLYKVVITVIIVVFLSVSLTMIAMYEYFVNGTFSNLSILPITKDAGIDERIKGYRKMIDKYYIGDIDEQKLIDGAITGYIEGLEDPYTRYISANEMEDYMEDIVGDFIGVGIYMIEDTEADKIMIISPIKSGPAEKAGILPNDYIISVNGEKVTGKDINIAPNKIKGEEGTTVKLEILRGTETLTFDLVREKIVISPVESEMLENSIGYISFSSFDEHTSKSFKEKYVELEKNGAKSLIIDLRNNGGGIVDEAINIADFIVPKNVDLLYEIDKDGKETIEKSKNDPIINMEIVVLINENSASSSEILAGALKDLDEATIVGSKSFGKGIIQQVLTMPNGTGLTVTCAKYLTPDRNEIHKIGITPDVVVEIPEDLKNELVIEKANDVQLQKAIEILK